MGMFDGFFKVRFILTDEKGNFIGGWTDTIVKANNSYHARQLVTAQYGGNVRIATIDRVKK
ncbi:MAG: hypothetical protein IAA72_04920 [Spirochaetes bacterium]|uniref:Uncharacterized protein n=1 Tax=Candidatus Ornithospirochaeta stercoravium TaxID=2840897 RepID=A0A9D9IB22_9SPIO|nr:hypothetical protein [Candidatus Ornithospirochaeta stercoravium]